MPFETPRWWWTGFAVALLLLATGGALNAAEDAMRDNYATDGCGPPWGGQYPGEQPEGVDCSGQRLTRGIIDALARATLGPGIAMAILAGVYLLGSAIAIALGDGRKEEQEKQEKKDDEQRPPQQGGEGS